MKWTAVCLVAVAMLGCLCDAQGGFTHYGGSQQAVLPPPARDSKITHEPTQSKQTIEIPLTWTYPEDPRPEPQPQVPFELRHPVPAVTVAVECRENMAHVEVKKDLFGTGNLISGNDLKLGNCDAVGEDHSAQVLIFEAELQGCGSESMMTDDSLVYSFILKYDPQPITDAPVLRSTGAAVTVECYYPRKQNVSSLALNPTWLPFAATKVAEEFLYFTLKLMTDEWQYERPVNQYFLGDMINIEATVMQYYHVRLRVYVDSCVATTTADVNSRLRYSFIENYGCLIDAKVTGSSSKFMPRTSDDKLQFQLEAFRFQGTDSGELYITCNLKATSANYIIDGDHRACSYVAGWQEASGSHGVCGSCDSTSGGSSSSTGSTASGGRFGSHPATGSGGGFVSQPATGFGGGGGYGSHSATGSGGGGGYGSHSATGSGGGGGYGSHSATGSGGGGGYGSHSATGSGGGYGVASNPGVSSGTGSSGTGSSGTGSYFGSTDHYGKKRQGRDLFTKGQQHQAVEWEGVVAIGPITIGEKMI